jgi:thiol:disulfide interchange protein DsbD
MGCVPFSKTYDFEVKVKEAKTAGAKTGEPPPAESKKAQAETKTPSSSAPVGITKTSGGSATPVSTQVTTPETLASFTLKGIIFGFITLLTPCVFPMIPITVSFFLKQKKEGSEALINATVYTLTIIASMTVIAYFFVQLFQQLTQQGITNLILGALFIYFALSLFGAYEITLPSFLTRWTSAGESKGGYIGTIFMAMTFTIISFSCVAPFLGGFAGATAAERPVLWNVSGALGFAVAFASPFFLLALFPSVLKTLPKSGNWLNTMKVVMGFLEVAAAIKFFRAAELRWTAGAPEYLTYDVCLALYIALCLLSGLYLLGLFLLPHDHGTEERRIGVGRLIWSLLFFSIGIYLFPGLFRSPDGEKLRPSGIIFSWVDAFLLPGADTKPLTLSFRGNSGEAAPAQKWVGFLQEAITHAKSKKQRIFIDFTGVT